MARRVQGPGPSAEERGFTVLLEEVRAQFRAVAEGQQGLAQRLDRLDARMDRLETRMDRLESRVTFLEQTVIAEFAKVNTRLDRLEQRMDGVEAQGRETAGQVGTLATRFEAHERFHLN